MEIGPGRVTCDKTIVVTSGTTVRGIEPAAELFVTGDFPAFRLEGGANRRPTGIVFEGFAISRDAPPRHGAPPTKPWKPRSESIGIAIWGDDIVVRDVTISNCFNAIRLEDHDPALSTNIRLERVRCTHAEPLEHTSQFGLFARHVDGLEVVDCDWADAWLDGIKLQKHCHNVSILRGRSHGNGRSFCNPGGETHSGDGIDCFAGAADLRIEDTVFDQNHGNGIVIKTVGCCGDGSAPWNPGWGKMCNIELCRVVCRDNTGHGIVIEGMYDFKSSRGIKEERLTAQCLSDRTRASKIRIDQACCEKNTLTGIFANGVDVDVSGATLLDNSWPQLEVGENSRNFTCVRTSIIRSCPPPATAILVAGERQRVYPAVNVQSGSGQTTFKDLRTHCGCARDGDGESATDSSDSTKTACARWGVLVEDGARGVSVDP